MSLVSFPPSTNNRKLPLFVAVTMTRELLKIPNDQEELSHSFFLFLSLFYMFSTSASLKTMTYFVVVYVS